MAKLTFSGQFLDYALKDFAQTVKDKKYKKMPYDTWRKMMQIITKYPDRMWWAELYGGDPVIKCDTGDCFKFEYDDYSFGEYWLAYCQPAAKDLQNIVSTATASISNINNYNYATIADNWSYSPTTGTATNEWVNINPSTITKRMDELETKISVKNGEYIKTKGENNMMNFNFDFGPCTNNSLKLSLYGIAVKNANDTYVAYDKATGKIMDVDVLKFDGAKYLYKMPCAIQNVAVGDVIVHNHKPVIVTAVNGTVLTAVDIAVNEQKDIIPTRNMFNFDYVTKVVSLFDFIGGFKADANNPFGNMLPLILMNDSNNKDMLPMLFMMNGNTNFDFSKNPMMLYFLMGDKGSNSNEMLPLMMLAAGGNFFPTASPTEPKTEAALTLDENYISEIVNKTLDKWLDNKMSPTSPSDNA